MLPAANNRKAHSSGLKQRGDLFGHIGRSPEVKRAPGRMKLRPSLSFLQFAYLCPFLIFSFSVRLAPFAFAKETPIVTKAVRFLLHV